MIKKIFIGSGIAFGAVAVVAGTISCDATKNNIGNEIKPEEKPNVPDVKPEEKPNVPDVKPEEKPNVPDVKPEEKPNIEQEKEKTDFIQALKSSSFTKPIKTLQGYNIIIHLPTGTAQNSISIEAIEQEIIEALQISWSTGIAKLIDIKKINNVGYEVSLNKDTNAYVKNIFGKDWINIMNESSNKDFKNINQVNYGFKLVISQENKSKAQLVPTYAKVSFAQQPSWLKENNFNVSLLDDQSLILDFNLHFKPKKY